MKSKISWTQQTWNPTTGCSRISAGCANCYMFDLSRRLKAMGQKKYENRSIPTVHPEELNRPYGWKKPQVIFVDSMSDLFHDAFMDTGIIQEVFKVMNDCQYHTFQVLTKRAENLEKIAPMLTWTDNIWMGVSVESESVLSRIDSLRDTPAMVKFLSIEPLLGPLPNLNLQGVDWVIVGGEKGKNARPMQKEWVYPIKNQCEQLNVPFFFKQTGGRRKVVNELLLDGVEYHNYPVRCLLNQ